MKIKRVFMPEKNVIVVVLVAIRKDNKILLLKRSKEPLKGYWALIGGKLKEEESISDAAIRETKEETGLNSKFIGIKSVLHERLYDEEKKCKYGFVFFLTVVEPTTFELQESHEGELKWIDLESIDSEKIILSDNWMIKKLLKEKTKVYEIAMEEEKGILSKMKVDGRWI